MTYRTLVEQIDRHRFCLLWRTDHTLPYSHQEMQQKKNLQEHHIKSSPSSWDAPPFFLETLDNPSFKKNTKSSSSCTSFSLASSLLFLLGLCFSLRICEECLRASSGIIFMKCCLSMCSCCCRRRTSSGILLRRTSAVLLPSQSFLQHDVVVFSCMIFSSFSRRESTQPKPKFRTFCKWVGGFCTAWNIFLGSRIAFADGSITNPKTTSSSSSFQARRTASGTSEAKNFAEEFARKERVRKQVQTLHGSRARMRHPRRIRDQEPPPPIPRPPSPLQNFYLCLCLSL